MKTIIQNKINREKLIVEYENKFDQMILKLEKIIKKKNDELGIQKKVIEILTDQKKMGKKKLLTH